jgi:ribosomal protein S18 acetylase RimI-like enzyme
VKQFSFSFVLTTMGMIEDWAELALATRLHRLADCLQQGVSAIYEERMLSFQARWFPVLMALGSQSPRSIPELAHELGLRQVAIDKIATEMNRSDLLLFHDDKRGHCERLLSLSPAGERTVRELQPIWGEVASATRQLIKESGHDLLTAIAAAEARLELNSMAQRVEKRLFARTLEIVDYSPSLAISFRELNLAGIEPLFGMEEKDRAILDDPWGQIIDPGGAILFALQGCLVIGTCALIRRPKSTFELAKMAVAQKYRRHGVGRRLAEAALVRAHRLGASTVVLSTSPKLEPAIALYRSLGFEETADLPVKLPSYERPTLTMRRDFNLNHVNRRPKSQVHNSSPRLAQGY